MYKLLAGLTMLIALPTQAYAACYWIAWDASHHPDPSATIRYAVAAHDRWYSPDWPISDLRFYYSHPTRVVTRVEGRRNDGRTLHNNFAFSYYCEDGSSDFDSLKSAGQPTCAMSGTSPLANGSNPINAASGNKYQRETDYVGSGPMPLRFTRHYNTQDALDTSQLGVNWHHTFEQALETSRYQMSVGTTILIGARIRRYDGKSYPFYPHSGSWRSDPDVPYRLEQTADGWVVTTPGDTVETYDVDGRLIGMTNRAGHARTLEYDIQSRLIRVSDRFGFSLELGYDAENRIETVSAANGYLYRYGYDAAGNLTSISYPDATPDDPADNPTRQYLYEDTRFPHALTGVVDENGNRYATWAYDDQGRAISSEHADGAERTTLTYNADGTTTVTNALGRETTYDFEVIYGVHKVARAEGHPTTTCAGSNKAYGYDDNGSLESKTDWNGNLTNYVHDARGLETSRTEAVGTPEAHTITTEWHPDYRVPIRITEPGKLTELSYDTDGRLLTRTERAAP